MANNKRIYARRPKLIDTRYTQLCLFTENGDAIRYLPKEDTRKLFNEFAYKVESNRKLLYKFALSRTKNTYEAEELVQNTIERALRKYDYKKGGNLTGWLVNTCKWLFSNQCRSKKTDRIKLTGCSVEDTEEFTEENTAFYEMEQKSAKDMIAFLPDEERLFAEMKFYYEMQYHEIAEQLRMPIGTVKYKLYLIRKTLKLQLNEYKK